MHLKLKFNELIFIDHEFLYFQQSTDLYLYIYFLLYQWKVWNVQKIIGVVSKVISDVASKFSNYADTVSMNNRFCFGQ